MGYTAMPVRQTVDFHPYLSPFVNVITLEIVRAMMKVNPGSQLLSKGEGMMRLRLGKSDRHEGCAAISPDPSAEAGTDLSQRVMLDASERERRIH